MLAVTLLVTTFFLYILTFWSSCGRIDLEPEGSLKSMDPPVLEFSPSLDHGWALGCPMLLLPQDELPPKYFSRDTPGSRHFRFPARAGLLGNIHLYGILRSLAANGKTMGRES